MTGRIHIGVLCCVFCGVLAGTIDAETITLRVTGSIQSVSTTRRNFGKLPRGYRAADWAVTNESAQPVKVPLARIMQEIHPGPGVSVLSRTSSTMVVEDAQGSNPITSIARIGTGAITGFAAAEGLKLIPQTGWASSAVLGAELGALALQYIFPTLQTHALQSITAMLPDPISIDGFGTQPGMVIVEIARKTPDPAPLDIEITIPYPGAK